MPGGGGADGVTFEEDFVALIDRVFAGARTIASMRQDLMKGRKTEIDYMNGAVVDLGKKYGIACPVNAAMATMIRYLESQEARLDLSPRRPCQRPPISVQILADRDVLDSCARCGRNSRSNTRRSTPASLAASSPTRR